MIYISALIYLASSSCSLFGHHCSSSPFRGLTAPLGLLYFSTEIAIWIPFEGFRQIHISYYCWIIYPTPISIHIPWNPHFKRVKSVKSKTIPILSGWVLEPGGICEGPFHLPTSDDAHCTLHGRVQLRRIETPHRSERWEVGTERLGHPRFILNTTYRWSQWCGNSLYTFFHGFVWRCFIWMWKGIILDDYRYILFTMISLWRMLSWNQIVSLPRHSCHSRPAFTPSCCDHPKRRRHKIHDHFLSESSFHDVGPARGWASCNFLFFFFLMETFPRRRSFSNTAAGIFSV